MRDTSTLTLDRLPTGAKARITDADWPRLTDAEGRRLRELGISIGAEVEMLHRGTLFFKDPLAIAIGAMRVALRAHNAAAFTVERLDGAGDMGRSA